MRRALSLDAAHRRKAIEHKQEVHMTTRIAITSSLFLGLAILLVPSAQAMSPPPLHQPDGMTTQVRYYGYGHRRYGYGGYRHYGYRHYGYNYGYRHYGYSGYRHYGYRPYAYRPYGYGVARGIARRNIRRGVLR
jgi:hypothetical protein